MPPATTISDSPSATACAARPTAFKPEPQTLLMVIAATRGSSPPRSAACRAGFCPSPACTTLPMMTSSTCLGSIPARRTTSATTFAPSSVAGSGESPPMNFPIAVRTALSMTGCCMSVLLTSLFSSTIGAERLARNRLARMAAVGPLEAKRERRRKSGFCVEETSFVTETRAPEAKRQAVS